MERILLYHCRALLMDEADTLLEGAYVVVEGETISSVGTQRPQGPFDREIDCGNNVLMPGLVNAHTHIPMTLLRGYGGGCDLHTWLNQWIFPTEAKLDGRAVRAGTGLALAELIAGGVTTIADMYMHTTDIAQTVLEAGISANLSCGGVYFGAPADFSPATCKDCDNQRRLTEEWHGAGNGQILVDASIHGEYTSNVPLWQWMAAYAQEKNWGCTSMSPRPSLSTRPARNAGARPPCRSWTGTGSGTPGPLPPTVSGPPRRTGPSWRRRGSPASTIPCPT